MGFFSTFFSKPISTELSVTSGNGFHLRPVAQFVSIAKKYSCEITASLNHKSVNAKGVNTLLGLSLEQEDTFILTCKGKDAQDALDALTNIFNTLMQNDKVIEVVKKEETQYEGDFIKGDIISSGIAIASVYHYKEQSIQKESHLSFDEAVEKSMDELEALYSKGNANAGIYLAQKELLASLRTDKKVVCTTAWK